MPAKRELATTVMGLDVSLPVLISPTGVQAVHPDGEVAVARAAAARGTAMGLSSFASKPVEEVVAANPKTLFQVYWSGTRDQIARRIERARAAGAVGLIATFDWSFANGRDWGSPFIPDRLDFKTMARMAPEAVTRPAWLLEFAAERGPARPDRAQHGHARRGAADLLRRVRRVDADAAPHVGRRAVAARAVDGGLHAQGRHAGGRRQAGRRRRGRARSRCPTTAATTLTGPRPPCGPFRASSAAVGGEIDVLLDGGVRRGSDVVKALALGAKAVMIGRAYLWGLAANGQAGVENVLDILRGGIDSTLLGLGISSVQDLGPADVISAPGFARTLGAPLSGG